MKLRCKHTRACTMPTIHSWRSMVCCWYAKLFQCFLCHCFLCQTIVLVLAFRSVPQMNRQRSTVFLLSLFSFFFFFFPLLIFSFTFGVNNSSFFFLSLILIFVFFWHFYCTLYVHWRLLRFVFVPFTLSSLSLSRSLSCFSVLLFVILDFLLIFTIAYDFLSMFFIVFSLILVFLFCLFFILGWGSFWS